MCGIAGYYSDKEPINKELFDQMVDIIELWEIKNNNNCYLQHTT